MRIVAYTVETSLAVTLSTLSEWEVVAASSVEEVVRLAPHASVVLVGRATTAEGLAAADEIYSLGVTIPSVVVGDVPGREGSVPPVVCRPFSLDDLRNAVDAAVAGAPATNGVYQPAVEAIEPTDEQLPVAAVNIIDLQQERFIRLEPEEEQRKPAEKQHGEEPPEITPAVAPAPVELPSPPQPQRVVPPPPLATPPAPITREPKQRRRRGRGRTEVGRDTESPLVAKMRRVAATAKDLDELLEELPMVGDLGTMCEALLGEVAERFTPEVASVYIRDTKGFRVVAAHGLSKVERGLIVGLDHPLFGDMIRSPETILIAPVDLAQGLVAGIGGARTQAMLVAPVQVQGRVVAMIVVGRDAFKDAELDSLDALATEAAPGLAVAQMLDRIRRT